MIADWYYSTAGAAIGPVTAEQLISLADQGVVLPHHHVRHSSWNQWASFVDATGALAQATVRPPTPPAPSSPPSTPPSTLGVPHRSADDADVAFRDRVVSWAIDAAVLVMVALVFGRLPGTASVWSTLFAFAAFVAYTVVLPARGLDTAGHRVTKTSVRNAETGEPADLTTLAARSAVLVLLTLPLLLGLAASVISASAHPRAWAWHDVATGSRVARGVSS